MSDTVPALSIRKLAKSFSEIAVLRDINLVVNRGEVVSVLGPSGAGKSTMLRCINWLEEPDHGVIHIGGRRIGIDERTGSRMGKRALAALRARTGMVFQSFNLWPHMSVLQNVMEAPTQVKGVSRDEARENAIRLLDRVGLAHRRDSFPGVLSNGQKQRVAIARAIAMKPEIILFDEPTSALDPEMSGDVLSVMKDLSDEGHTMIVVTHEMDFARNVSDQVVFLDDGKLIEKSAPDKFFTAPETDRVRRFLELNN